ncbi:MAG: Rne/Rng family ribonuclease [Alphaproteobacteria bacterium]|nr:Rne/Rng family ribonuclease [Alphaproteobacteria bacterium]
MTRKMLIDAANEEEVRVCVLENNRVEEFDFENESRRALRGNIYLARVTRVEPSLQAAFVEYGGNRHGFLAFSEIHPDYYQIPVSDRDAIRAAEAEEAELAERLNLSPDEDDSGSGDEHSEFGGDDDRDADEPASALTSDDDADEAADAEESDEKPKRGRRRRKPRARKAASDGLGEDRSETGADEGDADGEDAKAKATASSADAGDGVDVAKDHDSDDASDDDNDDRDDEEEEEERDEEELSVDDQAPGDDATAADDGRRAQDDNEADEPGRVGDDEEGPAFLTEASNDADGVEASDADDDEDEDEAEESDDAEREPEEFDSATRRELMARYDAARKKRMKLLRNYKIQEVVKRRQILLVQVVKEERGNKGAALTTFLSLAGRYCVLMPNTARGGGISRKIPNASDRKRLRSVVNSLEVPKGMGLIIRTAGAKRTKAEIKRDYDYLSRLWENIRTQTLKSIAPALIYEEASLIKRAIRDMYDKDIDQVLVEGDAGYREAKDFMKMLMPSHAKNVQPYKDETPLFLKCGVETQLDAMYQPIVRLKSGGYIVINQTEALIAIDVNSGKATRERNIEQTALKTNLEAAKELARQCRLRDLAGLIVVDFIDMEEHRNNRAVEKRFKEALKTDRARIQVGRISSFGLLEMSRQRRRSGIVDGTTSACPTCQGAGAVRSREAAGLRILRAIEGEVVASRSEVLAVSAALDVVLYVLNEKRDWLSRIENAYGVKIDLRADTEKRGDQFDVERHGVRKTTAVTAAVRADLSEAPVDDEPAEAAYTEEAEERSTDDGSGRKKRRRRRRSRRGGETQGEASADASERDEAADEEDDHPAADAAHSDDNETDPDGDRQRKRRRRGRRGGRRGGRGSEGDDAGEVDASSQDATNVDAGTSRKLRSIVAESDDEDDAVEKAVPVLADIEPVTAAADETEMSANGVDDDVNEEYAGDDDVRREDSGDDHSSTVGLSGEAEPKATKKSTRKGWWQRALGG